MGKPAHAGLHSNFIAVLNSVNQIQSYHESRRYYLEKTPEREQIPLTFVLSHQGRGVLGSLASNSSALPSAPEE